VARLSKRRRQEQPATGTGTATRTGNVTGTGTRSPSRYRAQKVRVQLPWWRSPWAWGSGAGAVVVAVVIVFVVIAASGPAGTPDAAAPSSVVSEVTGVSPSILATVGAGGLSDPFQKLPASAKALTSGGRPVVLMIGEDSCPYCAFERWGMVVALSRFGTFSNLHITSSSSTDVYPNTDSFSFYQSSYSSPYLVFQGVETNATDGAALQTPTATQESLLNTYDVPPYVPSAEAGGVPFVDLGGRWVANGDPPVNYTVGATTITSAPELLEGLTWQQIAGSLSDPSNYQAKGILGDANFLTAAICKLTGNQPGSVCGTSTITQLEGQLG